MRVYCCWLGKKSSMLETKFTTAPILVSGAITKTTASSLSLFDQSESGER